MSSQLLLQRHIRRRSFSLLAFTLLVFGLSGIALGQTSDQLPSDPGPQIVFSDGTRMEVLRYDLKGGLVVLTTREGKLHSVPRSAVDWEATDRANGSAPTVRPSPSSAPTGSASTPALSANGNGRVAVTGALIHGPSPPESPAIISRDDQGRATIRATRIDEPLTLDGHLEENIYRVVPSIGDFIQQEPHEGEPATEKTEVWFLYDDDHIFVGARCWDSQPERIVANEMRRDGLNITLNDHFAVILDTFYDRRNGFYFYTNPIGGRVDGQITDESNANRDWNPIWSVKTQRLADGWTVEMAIPFKSLRYEKGTSQIWGVNFRRVVPSKNETSFLTLVPASFGRRGGMKLSSAGTVVGIEAPSRSTNLEIKPYATAGLRTDLAATEPFSNDPDQDIGIDVKYGVTRSLVADFTYNTDFAQVEDDEQRVNLTRFSLFFPEKRDFFLEGQGIFAFGGRGTSRFGGEADNTPIMFFSRRIGLSDTTEVPIQAGGRLTGRAGAYTVGALAIQTDEVLAADVPTTQFSVLRLKRDVLRRSNIGFVTTHRSESTLGDGSNSLFGVDANLAFYDNLNFNTYYARTWTTVLTDEDFSYMASLDYGGDRYGLQLERLVVAENFNPEIGFLRRTDFRRNFAKFRFSPRPRSIPAIRKFSYEAGVDYFTNGAGRLETREAELAFGIDFSGGDTFDVAYTRSFEFLEEGFEIAEGVVIPIGDYRFQRMRYSYRLGPQRRASGSMEFQHGSFFGGDLVELGYSGRIELMPQLTLEPALSLNWADLPEGEFTTRLARARVSYALSPNASFGALVQYNSANSSLSSNLRFRWEYRPGSDLFIVYNDLRDPMSLRYPGIESRSFVVKFTRLFRL